MSFLLGVTSGFPSCLYTYFFSPIDSLTDQTLTPVLNSTVMDYVYNPTSVDKYSLENFPFTSVSATVNDFFSDMLANSTYCGERTF